MIKYRAMDYYKSYYIIYTFPVYIVTELTKQDGGTKPPRFTNEMYRDFKDSQIQSYCQVIDHGCHAKFDEIAAAEPYPFVGATARCDAEILIKTIDMMVKRANNVPKEALMIWGLPEELR
jgi:hypothetical protein